MRKCCATILVCLLAAAPAARAQYLDQNRVDRRPPPLPAAQPSVAVPGAAAAQSFTPFTLRAVQVSGVSVPPAVITGATRSFIGQRMDQAALNRLTQALSQAYGKSRIALFAVIAPEQDFAGGVVRLVVVEGYIERVDVEGADGRDHSLLDAYAARLTSEKPLSRATLQRYLSLIRDIPGLKPETRLVPGAREGAMRLLITLKQKDFNLGLTLSNGNNPLLGRTQVQATLAFYGLFREGEATSLSFATSTSTGRFQFVSLSHAEPLGDDGLTASLTGAYLRTHLSALNLTGEAETLQFLLSYPLLRGFEENLYLSGGLDGLNSGNAVLGSLLANERVRALRLSANYSLSSEKDVLSAGATVSNGLDGLGAQIIPAGAAAVDFHKLNLNLGYNRLLGEEWVARLKATAQLSGERLPASELINLGGADYGRAFPLSTLAGDSGAAASAEIAWHPASFFGLDPLKGSELYGFYDAGETWIRARPPLTGGTVHLASLGGGMRLALWNDTSLGLEAAHQLTVPPGLKHGWAFNIALRTLQ